MPTPRFFTQPLAYLGRPARMVLGLAVGLVGFGGWPARADDAPPPTTETVLLPGGVQVQTHTSLYDVAGSSPGDLARQMTQHAQAAGGEPFSASTTWQFTTSYRYQTLDDGACRAQPDSVQVMLDLTFVYPHWAAPAGADPDLVDDWSRFDDAVHIHEDGHGDLAVQAASDLAAALGTLPPAGSCQAFEDSAQALTQNLLDQHARDQAAYDGRTQHGLTQGAIFP